MPIHGNFYEFSETTPNEPFSLHQKKMPKGTLGFGPVKAGLGSMVAYQGDVKFEHAGSGGAAKWVKSKLTGEGLPAMDVSGQGELFLADAGQDVQILHLDNDMITCNGSSVLAFHSHMEWATVMWTSGITTSVRSDIGLKTLIGKGSGETFQLAFGGQGHVMDQPAETVQSGAGTTSGGGGGPGNLFS